MARRSGRASQSSGGPRDTKWIVQRVVLGLVAFAVISFAVQGGEYGTTDLLGQRSKLAREKVVVDSLDERVKELVAMKRMVESDSITQERIAREEFGMVRPGEVLYRFTEPADTSR